MHPYNSHGSATPSSQASETLEIPRPPQPLRLSGAARRAGFATRIWFSRIYVLLLRLDNKLLKKHLITAGVPALIGRAEMIPSLPDTGNADTGSPGHPCSYAYPPLVGRRQKMTLP